jgi:hypothetical protein
MTFPKFHKEDVSSTVTVDYLVAINVKASAISLRLMMMTLLATKSMVA